VEFEADEYPYTTARFPPLSMLNDGKKYEKPFLPTSKSCVIVRELVSTWVRRKHGSGTESPGGVHASFSVSHSFPKYQLALWTRQSFVATVAPVPPGCVPPGRMAHGCGPGLGLVQPPGGLDTVPTNEIVMFCNNESPEDGGVPVIA
jgi:hypothetical protein